MAQQPRIIKKYPNRRLYDTETSSYITLSDVKKLVLEQTEFRVEDAKTHEDLTRSILLQIILEEESAGAPMFSSDTKPAMPRTSSRCTFASHTVYGSSHAPWSVVVFPSCRQVAVQEPRSDEEYVARIVCLGDGTRLMCAPTTVPAGPDTTRASS